MEQWLWNLHRDTDIHSRTCSSCLPETAPSFVIGQLRLAAGANKQIVWHVILMHLRHDLSMYVKKSLLSC